MQGTAPPRHTCLQDVPPALQSAIRRHIAAVWVEETKKRGIKVDPNDVMAIFDEPVQAPVPLSRIAVVDLEASGLGSTSYPIEIGWALLQDDGSITSGSCLIRPTATWLAYDSAWSAAAERLTGITERHARPRWGAVARGSEPVSGSCSGPDAVQRRARLHQRITTRL
jgi:hypothetical protein